MTTFQERQRIAINEESKKRAVEIASRGFRDIINVMFWEDGLIEMRGQLVQQAVTTRKGFAGLLPKLRRTFGEGQLVKIGEETIQGRLNVQYGVK